MALQLNYKHLALGSRHQVDGNDGGEFMAYLEAM